MYFTDIQDSQLIFNAIMRFTSVVLSEMSKNYQLLADMNFGLIIYVPSQDVVTI